MAACDAFWWQNKRPRNISGNPLYIYFCVNFFFLPSPQDRSRCSLWSVKRRQWEGDNLCMARLLKSLKMLFARKDLRQMTTTRHVEWSLWTPSVQKWQKGPQTPNDNSSLMLLGGRENRTHRFYLRASLSTPCGVKIQNQTEAEDKGKELINQCLAFFWKTEKKFEYSVLFIVQLSNSTERGYKVYIFTRRGLLKKHSNEKLVADVI